MTNGEEPEAVMLDLKHPVAGGRHDAADHWQAGLSARNSWFDYWRMAYAARTADVTATESGFLSLVSDDTSSRLRPSGRLARIALLRQDGDALDWLQTQPRFSPGIFFLPPNRMEW